MWNNFTLRVCRGKLLSPFAFYGGLWICSNIFCGSRFAGAIASMCIAAFIAVCIYYLGEVLDDWQKLKKYWAFEC